MRELLLETQTLNFLSHLPRGGMGEPSPSPAFRWVHTATLGAVCTHTEYAGYKSL